MRIVDMIIQEQESEPLDKEILHKIAQNVNMRLFKSSPFYRQIVADVVNYMDSHLSMTYEDSSAPLGISAVKLGIPWNIIGFKRQGKTKFCLNPQILRYSTEKTEVSTNCGAFRFKTDLKVMRSNCIDLQYNDLKGQRIFEKNIGRYEGSFVIQHEVDHCMGICINDIALHPIEEKENVEPAVEKEENGRDEVSKPMEPAVSETNNNDIEIRRGNQGAIVQVRSKEVVVAGKKRKVDPYQLIRLIRRVTQNIGEYKSAEDIYGKIIMGALRKARGDLVNILEDSFGIHWQIDENTGNSVFYM